MNIIRKKLKTIFFSILFLGILLLPKIEINAAEKEIDVPLDKEYSSCTVKLEFSTPGTYSATITSPKQEVYEFSKIDDTTMSCIIDKAVSGNWNISISNTSVSDIGKVKVTVTAAKEQDTNLVDDIQVGKDISGLKIFFVDDTINVTWADDSCGDVNISITNLDNGEIIVQESVKEPYFSCELPTDATRITVSVVPSSSANIDGAALVYTYDVNNHPNATVTFPDVAIINTDTISVETVLNSSYGIYVKDNEKNVFQKDLLVPGSYTFEIPVEVEGENVIKFYFVDEQGNMRSTTKTIIKDTTAPKIELDEAYDGLSTYESSFSITGKVSDYNSFSINGKSVAIATDGQFNYDCSLHTGENNITITAEDQAGNKSEYDITLTLLEKKQRKISPFFIIIIAVFAFFIIKSLKRKKTEKKQSFKRMNHLNKNDIVDDIVAEDITKKGNSPILKTRKSEKKVKPQEISSLIKKNILNKNFEKNKILSKNENNMKRQKKKVIDKGLFIRIIKILFPVIIAFIIFSFLLALRYSPTASMDPTIAPYDLVIYNRLAYKNNEPERGDIISFKQQDTGELYCKRIIGIPGDTIQFIDGYVYINGTQLDENSYIDEEVETNSTKTFEVPENSYFVLGDNRENSYDSRFWKNSYVKREDIEGKYWFLIPLHVFRK